MSRTIIHVDMDEFFAAVEKLDNPSLRGKCLLIGGDPRGRGVVSTASYEAREYGCRSAMPMATALRLCPHAVVLRGRHERYGDVSRQIHEVFTRFAPLVEPLSIDEAFLDVTGSERLFGTGPQIGLKIKQAIRDDLHLTASVGVAPNKFLAKLASDLEKPNGLTVITADGVHGVLDPLPVRKLWGVGPAAEKQLTSMAIRTIGQLCAAGPEALVRRLGDIGQHLHNLASGIDDREVTPDSEAKSISQEITFSEDVDEIDELRRVLLTQTEQVAWRLRRHELKARTVTLKLRYGDFTTLTRSQTLDGPTDVTHEFRQAATGLFDAWSAKSFQALRLLGMGVSQLSSSAGRQGELFEDPQRIKQKKLDRAVDDIAAKYGRGTVRRGGPGDNDQ